MESTSLCSSILPFCPFSDRLKTGLNHQKRDSMKLFTSGREAKDKNYSGKLVDEGMIVLRKRIHEMKMVERNYEPPLDWMDWKKPYYASYNSIICDIMGVLQSQLMNTRPSLALGMIALVTLSVPTSMAVVFFHLVEMSKGILAGIHAP